MSSKIVHDGNKYEVIDISVHPEPTNTSSLAAKIRWFRWLKTKEGQAWYYWWHFIRPREIAEFHRYWGPVMKRDNYPNNPWCLTCNAPQSMIDLIPDGKGFMVLPNFYGRWNYCHCPISIIDQDFYLANLASTNRRTTMKWAVTAEITLQEGDEKTKVTPTVGYVSFEVEADDLDAAIVIARGMLEANTNEGIISSIAAVLEA